MSTTIVAAVQLQAGRDLDANLEQADRLVRRAAARGAEVVLLPEKWNGLGSAADLHRLAEPLGEGPSSRAMAGWASELGISVIGGSITEAAPDGVLHNTCAVYDPAGEVVAVYRKMHMFDVDVGDHVFRESDHETAGSTPATCDLAGWSTGLSICYDLRFPELYRRYADDGARLLSVPAAFTLATGKDHWELLLRARAVENQCFVVAAGQWGLPDGQPRYGRSMIVDAWGVVLAQAADGDAVVVAEIDAGQQDAIRTRLPALAHRRRDLLG
jgi:predicted amidohydrolase